MTKEILILSLLLPSSVPVGSPVPVDLRLALRLILTIYDRKKARYGEPCKDAGMIFRPLPMDALGEWSDMMVAKVRRMGIVTQTD